jgi:hypothetical protein
LLLFFIAAGTTFTAKAQPQLPEPPIPVDPTPLEELISPLEKQSLADARDQRRLAEAYLKISDTYLLLADSTIKSNDHRSAERHLDIFNKSLAKAVDTALAMADGRRKMSKKVEQYIYKQIRILEDIQRQFPPERLGFPEAALKSAKALRVKALNAAFASGDVLKSNHEEDKKPDGSANDPQAAITGRPAKKGGPDSSDLTIDAVAASFGRFGVRNRHAQLPGDYLTDEEDLRVREAQEPDDRTKVFMKIADRRLALITGPPPVLTQSNQPSGKPGKADKKADKKAQEKAEKEQREWGQLPNLEPAELLRHYARAIEECMGKLEDAYERNPKGAALAKALTMLRDETDRHLTILRSLTTKLTGEAEARALARAIDEAETANKGARSGPTSKQ